VLKEADSSTAGVLPDPGHWLGRVLKATIQVRGMDVPTVARVKELEGKNRRRH
jgi:hypothetical protein